MPGRVARRADAGVAANARLTASNAVVLLALLAAEGVTILRVRELLTPHVFIGMVLIPPVLLKVASTGWRFARYYRGAPAYRRKGPPPLLLRLLGPVVVILTVVLLASGVGLLLVGPSWLPLLLKVHKASFVLWFGAMTIHVLGHLGEVFRLAPRDWLRRTGRDVTEPPAAVADRGQPGSRLHARISPAQPRGSLAGREARRVTVNPSLRRYAGPGREARRTGTTIRAPAATPVSRPVASSSPASHGSARADSPASARTVMPGRRPGSSPPPSSRRAAPPR